MIRINKSSIPPNKISVDGATQCAADKAEYLANRSLYSNQIKGRAKKKFNKRIYGCSTVKAQLKQDQHNKCCYCESKFTANSPGDVEHFRPKGRIKIPGTIGFQKPAYYWLAYDWENLFFSCEECNRSNKGDKFPLVDETKRATPHNNSNLIKDEQPKFICPLEDASNHIEFDKDTINFKDERGELSIKYYGLRRPDLLERRLARFNELKNHKLISRETNTITQDIADTYSTAFGEILSIADLKDIVTESNNAIAQAISDVGEFSLMSRTLLK